MKNIVLNTKQIQETNFMEEKKCPICGVDVTVAGEGETHFYVPKINFEPYVYKADIIAVFDGDTCTAIVDLGMRVSVEITIRLAGINAPEMRSAQKLDGIKARDFLRSRILMKSVLIKTYKDKTEKYGRWLADIWMDGVNINQEMITNGHAVAYDE